MTVFEHELERLRQMIKLKGLNYCFIADAVGISRQTVSNTLRGEKVKWDTLNKIAKYVEGVK